MDLYRYEFAEWCPLPAKAVGEGCVGIEPLFVRRWFGKGDSFLNMAMLGICVKFLGCISISVRSGVTIISTLRSTLFPVFRGKGRFSLRGSPNPSKCNAILVVTITIESANPTPHIVLNLATLRSPAKS